MHGDLEKARQEVIEAALQWAEDLTRSRRAETTLLMAIYQLVKAETSSDGGRMNEEAIGGENV